LEVQADTIKSCLNTVETDSISYKITTNRCLIQGPAPIVLYRNDIREFKINEIEIKPDKPFSIVTNFNRVGDFKSFSIYENYSEKELLYCSLHSDDDLYDWLYSRSHFFNRNAQLNFGITSNDAHSYLSELTIFPFIGNNGYVHIDYQNRKLIGNTITYSSDSIPYISEDNSYDILKKTKSDTLFATLYEIRLDDEQTFMPLQERKTINLINKDTTDIQYYYYGDNPEIVYSDSKYYTDYLNPIEITDTIGIDLEEIESDRQRECECIVTIIYDEERKTYRSYEVNEILTTDYSITFHEDTIYNYNRWLGLLEWNDRNERFVRNQPKRNYYEEINEYDIVNKVFEDQEVTCIHKKDFLINGQNGYDYLLEAYNNRKVVAKDGYTDENGKYIREEYKLQKEITEITELPDKIIVQLTLTDFWYIQLIGE
jgi:hypothetical protein